MSSRARAKRRGHVQQYNTGGSGAEDAAQATPGPTRPSPAMPRFPPAANFAASAQNHAGASENIDPYSNQAADSAWSHNVSAGILPPGVSESTPAQAQKYPPYEPQSEEQKDAWDDEIGDIPWEEDDTQPPKDNAAENAHSFYNDDPASRTQPESHAAPEIDPQFNEEEDLAELPWDDEEEQAQMQDQTGHVQRHEEEEQYSVSSPSQGNYEAEPYSWEQHQQTEHQYQPPSHEGQNPQSPAWEAQIRTEEEAPEQEQWNANETEEPLAWNSHSQHSEAAEERRVSHGTHDSHFDQEYPQQEDSHDDYWGQQSESYAPGHASEASFAGSASIHHDNYSRNASLDHSRNAYSFPSPAQQEQPEQQEEAIETEAQEYGSIPDQHTLYGQDTYPAHELSEEHQYTEGHSQHGAHDTDHLPDQQQAEYGFEDHNQQSFERQLEETHGEHTQVQGEFQSELQSQQDVHQSPVSEWGQQFAENTQPQNDHEDDFFGSLNKDAAGAAAPESTHGNDTLETRENGFPWENQSVTSQAQSQWPSLDQPDSNALNIHETEGQLDVQPTGNVEESDWMAGPQQQHHVDEEEASNRERNGSFRLPSSDSLNELLPVGDVTSNQAEEGYVWPEQSGEHFELQENADHPPAYISQESEQPEQILKSNGPSIDETGADSAFDNQIGRVPGPDGHGIGLYVENSDVDELDLSSTSRNVSFSSHPKSKALELLDLDDDLLLDDDFLEEELEAPPAAVSLPETTKSNVAPKTSFANKYANPVAASQPSAQYAPQASATRSAYAPPPAMNILPKKELPQAEPVVAPKVKKNDAYDFPIEFPKQRAKPASRAMSTNGSITRVPTQAAPGPSPINTQPPVGIPTGAGSEKKPFFEDLPVALPKPGSKPKRAAPAATSASPKIAQSLGPPEPSKALPIKSPKNPYASLAPKVGLANQQPFPQPFQQPLQQAPQQQHSVPGGSERSTPSKYQPSVTPMGRPSHKTPGSLPVKPGVVPPPANMPMGNPQGMQQGGYTQGGFGAQPANNQHAAPVNQFAPPPLPSSAYSPVSQQSGQFGAGALPVNQYAPPPAAGQANQYAPPPAAGQANQYAPPPAAGQANQYAPPPAAGQANQYAPPPAVGQANQYAPPPAAGPGNQYAPPHGSGSTNGAGNQFPSVQHAGQVNQFAPGPVNQYATATAPANQYAPGPANSYAPVQASQYATVQAPQPMPQPFPQANSQQGQSVTSQDHLMLPVNRAPRVNTNLPKSTDKNASLSPYVPDTGPYGPSARSHSRTSSLIGGNAKDSNPYAPAGHGHGMATSPSHALAPVGSVAPRKRGKSIAKPSLPTINQAVEKIENPEALLRRQFPIFSWGPSDQAVVFISQASNGFDMPSRSMRVAKVSELLPRVETYADFPGPLSKSKTKRKEIETWLEKNTERLKNDYARADELLINEILYALVQHDGDFVSASLQKRWASILTPNVDLSVSADAGAGFLSRSGPGLAANAFKLDNAGISTMWALIQAGKRDEALQFATSKQDWALAFIVAQSLGAEVFSKVCSDYARITFPFQTNQNTRVQHLMPLLLKIFVGNTKGVIEDFVNVPSEAEFAKTHYREIVSAAIVNGLSTEFLVEFGNFLKNSGLTLAGEICFIMAGIVLSRVPLQNGAVFSTVGSFTSTSVYSEIYEYVLSVSSISTVSIPPTGLPDLLSVKIRRAQLLADIGHFAASRRYCDHIGGVFKALGKTPLVTPHMSADFKHLLVRLSDCSSSDSGWLGSRLSKVNLDKVWGQLDKFIGGDDSTAKSEKVFSKFSPTVSRKSSMLDVTAAVNYRPENFAAPPQIASAPPTEFSSPTQRHDRSYAPQNFTPSQSQTLGSQPHASGKPAKSGAPLGRYHPQNGSSSSVNLLESSGSNKIDTLSSTPASFGPPLMNSRNQIYSNRAAQLSSSSIASQVLHSNGIRPGASPNRNIPASARPTEGNEFNRSNVAGSVKGHSRVSSIQDESFDAIRSPLVNRHERKHSLQDSVNGDQLPVEVVKPTEDRANEHELDIVSGRSDQPRRASVKSRASESVIVTAPSEPESKTEAYTVEAETEQESEAQAPVESEPEKFEPHDEVESVEPQAEPAPLPTPPPPPPVSKPIGPKRVNPYAPSGSGKTTKGSNKYGPSAVAASKYTYKFEPKTEENTELSGAPTPFIDIVADDKPQTEEEKEVSEPVTEKPQVAEKMDVKQNDTHQEFPVPGIPKAALPPHNSKSIPRPLGANTQRGPQTAGRRNPYAPAVKQAPANVDTSFDAAGPEDVEEIEGPREPLILNGQESSLSDYKPGFVNPYQEGKKNTANLPVQSGFDEFPIPGSPEYTTRANSVIGHTGLYSSRLSQSQQSALYQQYEVKDDTVLDYVPVPEEQEEDEIESKKKNGAAIKKDMEEAKRKISEEMSSKGGGQNAESGWFKGWLGNSKNDDKPKPIRAKLGKANTFKYDETHKRWIDTSRPLEEQLKESAPPPPPKKKAGIEKEHRDAPAIVAPAPMRGPSAIPNTIGGRRTSVTKTPAKAESGSGTGPEAPSPRPNLANAGLDDLLNMNSANKAAAARRGKRRYVNVMETK